jgi:hypothetical protein
MLKNCQAFALLSSSLGLLTINFALSQPASASIVCEPGTISNHSNGSLSSCILGQDMTLQVSNSSSGISTFPCKAKGNIDFDEKGQFNSCRLSEEVNIKQGNSIKQCLVDYRISVTIAQDGNQYISCSR